MVDEQSIQLIIMRHIDSPLTSSPVGIAEIDAQQAVYQTPAVQVEAVAIALAKSLQ